MGGSFSHRGFTDMLPAFALSMACFFDWVRQTRGAAAVGVTTALAIALATAQMIQYWLLIIPFSDTSWELYKAAFLKFTK